MPQPCRLIFDEPASGVWNMSVDEALLECAANGGPPTLRFYRWSEPTLSLGYFQGYTQRESHEPSHRLPIVRRSSGGGAIVHDSEITYSLTLPAGDARGSDSVQLTCLAHRALISALHDIANDLTELSTCGSAIAGENGDEPFLCFQRRSPGDVICPDGHGELHKLCGSAQRRRRGVVLQHGGLLLARSAAAPELPGLVELTGVAADASQVARLWSRKMLSELDLDTETGEITDDLRADAERIAAQRFANPTWTRRR